MQRKGEPGEAVGIFQSLSVKNGRKETRFPVFGHIQPHT